MPFSVARQRKGKTTRVSFISDLYCRLNYKEEEVYLQIQKALKPMRIQTIICTYMVMAHGDGRNSIDMH